MDGSPTACNKRQPWEELITTAPPPTAPTALVQEALGTEIQDVEEPSGFSALSRESQCNHSIEGGTGGISIALFVG